LQACIHCAFCFHALMRMAFAARSY